MIPLMPAGGQRRNQSIRIKMQMVYYHSWYGVAVDIVNHSLHHYGNDSDRDNESLIAMTRAINSD